MWMDITCFSFLWLAERDWKEVVFIGHDPLKSSAIAPIHAQIAFRSRVKNTSEELLSYLHYSPGSSPTEWLWSEEDAMVSILALRSQSVCHTLLLRSTVTK
jgi:hypothetical protein